MQKLLLVVLFLIFSVTRVRAMDFAVSAATESSTIISATINLGSVTLSNCPEYTCYLFGALQRVSGDSFFGQTQNAQGEWIDYIPENKLTKELIKVAFYPVLIANKSWSGVMQIRYNPAMIGYQGPGNYVLSIFRYTGNSASYAGDTATAVVNLTAIVPTPTPTPEPTTSPSPSPSSTVQPTVVLTPTPTAPPTTPKPTPKPTLIPTPSPELLPPPSGTVAGISTEIDLSGFGASPSPIGMESSSPSPSSLTLNRSRAKTVIIIGSGLILLSLASFFGYRKYLGTIAK